MDIRQNKHNIPGLCWTVTYWKGNRAASIDENWDHMKITMFGGHPSFSFTRIEEGQARTLVHALTFAHAHGKRARSAEIRALLEI